MCNVLKGYEPQAVFDFFEKICSIPHGSGNTAEISSWIAAYAQNKGFSYSVDECGNIIIKKDASKGYESHPAIILQGHMDMVAVKTEDCTLDMEHDGLDIAVDGDNIYAKGTSLGGDDGIAVAYMLAILDDDSIKHPALEMIFTTDEEVGLAGVSNMDVSSVKGRKLLNLDTEEEGVLIAGCAGGIKAVCSLPVTFEPMLGNCMQISVLGLIGGHSGTEIHKERGNANLILARVLNELHKHYEIGLVNLYGGEKDNTIPRQSKAVIITNETKDNIVETVNCVLASLKSELCGKDDNINIIVEEKAHEDVSWIKKGCAVPRNMQALIYLCLMMNPNGVQAMSSSVKDTVETSLNCGIMKLREEDFLVRYALRSSISSAKTYLFERIKTFVTFIGGTVTTEGNYPPWEYQVNSEFREQVLSIYESMYKKPMEVQVIHAGLECGYLSEKLPGLESVSIGPDMKDIHTVNETLSIASVKRVWEFIIRILEMQ